MELHLPKLILRKRLESHLYFDSETDTRESDYIETDPEKFTTLGKDILMTETFNGICNSDANTETQGCKKLILRLRLASLPISRQYLWYRPYLAVIKYTTTPPLNALEG